MGRLAELSPALATLAERFKHDPSTLDLLAQLVGEIATAASPRAESAEQHQAAYAGRSYRSEQTPPFLAR